MYSFYLLEFYFRDKIFSLERMRYLNLRSQMHIDIDHFIYEVTAFRNPSAV